MGSKTTKIKNIAVLKFVKIEEVEVFLEYFYLIFIQIFYKYKILALGQRM